MPLATFRRYNIPEHICAEIEQRRRRVPIGEAKAPLLHKRASALARSLDRPERFASRKANFSFVDLEALPIALDDFEFCLEAAAARQSRFRRTPSHQRALGADAKLSRLRCRNEQLAKRSSYAQLQCRQTDCDSAFEMVYLDYERWRADERRARRRR